MFEHQFEIREQAKTDQLVGNSGMSKLHASIILGENQTSIFRVEACGSAA